MKRLALLRHAKSSWGNSSLVDHDRPLSTRGERDAPEMGSRLFSRGTEPSLFLSSTAIRAITTTKKIMEALKTDRRLYLASHSDILKLIEDQENTIYDLFIVGHNPGLTNLANHLLPDLRLENLPTTGIVAIESAAQKWSELSQSSLRLLYYDYPKNTKLPPNKN